MNIGANMRGTSEEQSVSFDSEAGVFTREFSFLLDHRDMNGIYAIMIRHDYTYF